MEGPSGEGALTRSNESSRSSSSLRRRRPRSLPQTPTEGIGRETRRTGMSSGRNEGIGRNEGVGREPCESGMSSGRSGRETRDATGMSSGRFESDGSVHRLSVHSRGRSRTGSERRRDSAGSEHTRMNSRLEESTGDINTRERLRTGNGYTRGRRILPPTPGSKLSTNTSTICTSSSYANIRTNGSDSLPSRGYETEDVMQVRCYDTLTQMQGNNMHYATSLFEELEEIFGLDFQFDERGDQVEVSYDSLLQQSRSASTSATSTPSGVVPSKPVLPQQKEQRDNAEVLTTDTQYHEQQRLQHERHLRHSRFGGAMDTDMELSTRPDTRPPQVDVIPSKGRNNVKGESEESCKLESDDLWKDQVPTKINVSMDNVDMQSRYHENGNGGVHESTKTETLSQWIGMAEEIVPKSRKDSNAQAFLQTNVVSWNQPRLWKQLESWECLQTRNPSFNFCLKRDGKLMSSEGDEDSNFLSRIIDGIVNEPTDNVNQQIAIAA